MPTVSWQSLGCYRRCVSVLCPLDCEFSKPVSINFCNPETHLECDKQEVLTKCTHQIVTGWMSEQSLKMMLMMMSILPGALQPAGHYGKALECFSFNPHNNPKQLA